MIPDARIAALVALLVRITNDRDVPARVRAEVMNWIADAASYAPTRARARAQA